MTTSELNNYLTLEDTQKTIKAQYERNQAQLQLLRGKARQLLRASTKEYQAIIEFDGRYHRLFIDCDEEIQVEIISKIS